jgi:CheY-like chemotaxis protein
MYGKTNFQTVPLAAISPAINSFQAPMQPVVLVVDDEQVIADTLVAILGRSGYMALAAYDGAAALEIARVIPPQMLITDVHMPGMSGIDLAIAVMGAVPDCKVLLFSGRASMAEMLAVSRRAGYDFGAVSKPIHPTELLAHLAECFAGSAEQGLRA